MKTPHELQILIQIHFSYINEETQFRSKEDCNRKVKRCFAPWKENVLSLELFGLIGTFHSGFLLMRRKTRSGGNTYVWMHLHYLTILKEYSMKFHCSLNIKFERIQNRFRAKISVSFETKESLSFFCFFFSPFFFGIYHISALGLFEPAGQNVGGNACWYHRLYHSTFFFFFA